MKQTPIRFHKRQPRVFVILLVLLMLGTPLIACSGGSSDSGGGSTGASYTGSTSQAALTSENTATLLADSYQGAMTSDTMVPFAAVASGTQGDGQISTTPLALKLQAAFSDSLAQVAGAGGNPLSTQQAAMASASSTIDGDCGGTASYTVSYDDGTGIFSGSFGYNGFCAGGVTLSGSATFSGRIDTGTSTFDYFTFTFSSLTSTAEDQTLTVNGSLECDFQGSDILITTDMVVVQSSTSLTCWLNNFTLQISGSQMWISGRYYDPVHGYIDFLTEEALIVTGQYPSAGLIVFTGATGINGQPTSARLRALSSTTCRVTADFDGDGVLEYDSGEILWTDL